MMYNTNIYYFVCKIADTRHSTNRRPSTQSPFFLPSFLLDDIYIQL